MSKIEIKMLDIDEIKVYEKNPRKNKNAVDAVANSIKDFGFKVPIVIDKDNVIVGGHTRRLAAKKLGIKKVPCVVADDLSEQQIKAFRLADNQVAEFSTWDEDKLAIELEELGLDMSAYGFGIERALSVSEEIDVDDFNDEKFDYTCPCCGFRFNK